ncbi:uncharacterized protein LOC144101314 [Amblyomma americanum]
MPNLQSTPDAVKPDRRASTPPAEHATPSPGCGTRATPSRIRHRVSSARLQSRKNPSLLAPSVAICPRVGPSKAPVSLFGLWRRPPRSSNCASVFNLEARPGTRPDLFFWQEPTP